MGFIERLLQGIQGKAEAEQKLKAQALADDEAKRKSSESFAEIWLSEKKAEFLAKTQFANRELERCRVIENLEAVRDGVWKVGEIKTIHKVMRTSLGDGKGGTLAGPIEEPIAHGIELIHTYPAAIPIMEGITRTIETRESPASSGGGEMRTSTIGGIGFTGEYRTGRGFDAVIINAHASVYGSSGLILEAGSGLLDEQGYTKMARLEDNRYFDWHYSGLGYENNYPYNFGKGRMHITSPSDLEAVITNYCHEIIKNNRLPTQNEAVAQRKHMRLIPEWYAWIRP